MITLTYAEVAAIVLFVALVIMVIVYLRNDSAWCEKYNTLLNRCRVDHQGWIICTTGLLRGLAIPPPPPMPAVKPPRKEEA